MRLRHIEQMGTLDDGAISRRGGAQ
jgi:hypothetical protein